MVDDSCPNKRFSITVIDPGCGCCSYVMLGQYDTLAELEREWPDSDSDDYSVDVDCYCDFVDHTR